MQMRCLVSGAAPRSTGRNDRKRSEGTGRKKGRRLLIGGRPLRKPIRSRVFFYFPVQEQMIPSSESSAILQSAGGGCALRTRGRLLLAPFHQRVVSFFTASRRWEHALGRVLSPHLRWTRRRCDATERHGRSISVADEICMTRWRSVRKVRNPKRPPPPSFATLHGSIILFHSSRDSK